MAEPDAYLVFEVAGPGLQSWGVARANVANRMLELAHVRSEDNYKELGLAVVVVVQQPLQLLLSLGCGFVRPFDSGENIVVLVSADEGCYLETANITK